MKEWKTKYLIQFWGGMIGYMFLIPFSAALISNQVFGGTMRYIIAILPALPLAIAIHATVRNVRQLDEMQRKIHFESVLASLLLTGGVTFTYGLLETSQLVPHMPNLLVAPMMILFWGAALSLIKRRYD